MATIGARETPPYVYNDASGTTCDPLFQQWYNFDMKLFDRLRNGLQQKPYEDQDAEMKALSDNYSQIRRLTVTLLDRLNSPEFVK